LYNESQRADLSGNVRTIQIITAGLTAGAAFFLVFVLVIGAVGDAAKPAGTPIITYIAIGFSVVQLGLRQFVPDSVAAASRRRLVDERRQSGRPARYANAANAEIVDRATDAISLCQAFKVKTIISAALIEGVTFFTIIAYMIEHWWPGLALAIALICGLALHIPTPSRVEHWVEDQLRLAEQEVQLGG